MTMQLCPQCLYNEKKVKRPPDPTPGTKECDKCGDEY